MPEVNGGKHNNEKFWKEAEEKHGGDSSTTPGIFHLISKMLGGQKDSQLTQLEKWQKTQKKELTQ